MSAVIAPSPRCATPRCRRTVECGGLDVCVPCFCKDLGVTYRQLDHWVRQGYLRPAVAQPGTGRPRSWPPFEIKVAARMARLTAAGLMPGSAAEYARYGWPNAELDPGVVLMITGGEL